MTGAASGIGAATAAELSKRGMAVLVADINGEAANGQAEAINASGGRALGTQVDVAEEADIQRMMTLAVDSFGHLDLLHNNAAATQDSVNDEDILTMDVAIWDRTMAVNLRGAMLGCKHAIPYMLQSGGGVIVNTSSGAGTLAEPSQSAYAGSKAAMHLTRSVAVQYGKKNIRCVSVAPGITMAPEIQDHIRHSGWLQMMERHHLTPSRGTPRDVARLVAFLAVRLGSIHHRMYRSGRRRHHHRSPMRRNSRQGHRHFLMVWSTEPMNSNELAVAPARHRPPTAWTFRFHGHH